MKVEISKSLCDACHTEKPVHACGLCRSEVCKNCFEAVPLEEFTFSAALPVELTQRQVCQYCYSARVQPAIQEYRATLKRARSVFFLDKPRRRPLPILRKSADALSVTGCADREETILRLGFLAAEKGFNAVIRAEVFPKKIRNAGYQKMEWTGTGFPAVVDEERIEWQAD